MAGFLYLVGCKSKKQLKEVFLLESIEEFILFIRGLFSNGDYDLICSMVSYVLSFENVPSLTKTLKAFHVSEEHFNALFGKVGELLHFCLSGAQRRENSMKTPLGASEALYVLSCIKYCCEIDSKAYFMHDFIPVLQIRSRKALNELMELRRVTDAIVSRRSVSIDESKIFLVSETIQNHPTRYGLDYFERKHYSPAKICSIIAGDCLFYQDILECNI